jgi:hypothetical protein
MVRKLSGERLIECGSTNFSAAPRETHAFQSWNCGRLRRLILFAEGLGVGFAVGIEEFFAALLPGDAEFGGGDVPIGAALFGNGAEILAEIFESGAAPEPIAVVDLINDKTGLEDYHMGNHGIVGGIGVFGDVEILLDDAGRVGEERPMSADAGAVFIGFGDVVGADGDEAGVGDFDFAMKLNEEFGLAAVLGAETAAAEDEDHGVLSLEVRELAALRGVVGKLVVGEDGAGNDVGSHGWASRSWMRGSGIRYTNTGTWQNMGYRIGMQRVFWYSGRRVESFVVSEE